MRRRLLACSALNLALIGGCYPQYVGLGVPTVAGPPDYANIQTNLTGCHAHLESVARNAYAERKDQYRWTNFIASVTLLGGGASTFFGDKTVKTVGGVASLVTGFAGIWKGKTETDLEGTQARDAKVRETWGAVVNNVSQWRAAWTAANSNAADPGYVKADNELIASLNRCTLTVF